MVNEDCDDGNTNDSDGCSRDCKTETGWECHQPDNDADTMTVPVTYRDFMFAHPDFEESITGSFAATTGLVKDTLDSEGKPVFSGVSGNAGKITSADSFKQWYRDVSGTNSTVVLDHLAAQQRSGRLRQLVEGRPAVPRVHQRPLVRDRDVRQLQSPGVRR